MKALLKLSELPRSTYYYWIRNSNRPDKDKELKLLIQNIYDELQGHYGYRRVRDELIKKGYKINHKKVQRIMKELNLKSLVHIKKYGSYKENVGKIVPSILERNFKAEKPNEKWATCITFSLTLKII